jgi:hypothetical protein
VVTDAWACDTVAGCRLHARELTGGWLPFRLDSGWRLPSDGSYILGSYCNLTAMAAFQYNKMSLMKSNHSAYTRKSQMVAIYRYAISRAGITLVYEQELFNAAINGCEEFA